MQTKVPFESVLYAFMNAKDTVFFISEGQVLSKKNPSKEEVAQLAGEGYLPIPRMTPEFEKKAREAFVYEISDQKLAEQIFEASMGEDAVFNEVVLKNMLSLKWDMHKKVFSTNAIINWLTKSGIEFPGQKLTPDLIVNQVDKKEIPEEMKSLTPILCNACQNKEDLVPMYFKTSIPCDNLLMEKDASAQLLAKGIEHFTFLGREKKDMIAACVCPKCKSTDVNWDFR